MPYTEEVLAVCTDTNIDIVRSAIALFEKLKMITISPDGDLIIDEVIHEMVGKISEEGIRKRKYRKKLSDMRKLDYDGTMSQNVPTVLEKEKDNRERVQTKTFTPPSLDDVRAYVSDRQLSIDPDYFHEHYTLRNWKDKNGNQAPQLEADGPFMAS